MLVLLDHLVVAVREKLASRIAVNPRNPCQHVGVRGPAFQSRTGRVYRPGIGPHSEDRAVDLILDEMKRTAPGSCDRLACRVPYPVGRQTCDIVLVGEWLIEVKMARFFGDNGKPDDTSLKDVLSPFESDRSAVTDCAKLAAHDGTERRAMVIYGFDSRPRPLDLAIQAFEALASRAVVLGPRVSEPFTDLVHPIHREGAVFGWDISRRSSASARPA
jgi:hypothetical protein